jgi:GH15 family glucan-1,4-alpha-glucosidase
MRQERYLQIRDYAVIGDCHTAALISRDGSIDWCCLPRFDSPSVFARLLDAEKGGWFHIQPLDSYRVQRRYLEGTNVLETTFEAPGGMLTLKDFMPAQGAHEDDRDRRQEPPRQIVRLLSCLQGRVEVEVSFQPRFDYARVLPTIAALPHRGVVATGPAERLILAADLPWTAEPSGAKARIALSAGECGALVLSHETDASAAVEPMAVAEVEQLLRRTIEYWRAWSARCTYQGPYREAVVRSALTLKLLSHAPSGAIVAAPTTSLPEEIGGERN